MNDIYTGLIPLKLNSFELSIFLFFGSRETSI